MSNARRGGPRRTWNGVVALLGLVVSGCAGDAELDTLEPKGKVAKDIQSLVVPVFIVAGVVLVLVCGAVVYLGLQNRVKDYDDDDFPEQVHGNNALEIGWTVAPAAILLVVAIATLVTHIAVNDTEANALMIDVEGDETMWEPKVVVVGQQWWWEFRYYLDRDITRDNLTDARDLPPADIVTSGQMVIPTDQEIELLITSRDVLHSYWIPALNGKRDAAPNRIHDWKLEASDPGVYHGQCTEFCGLSHSRMQMQVVALDAADFQVWLDEQMAPAVAPGGAQEFLAAYRAGESAPLPDDAGGAARGLAAFTVQCASCHLVNGVNDLTYDGANQVSGAAPNLTHLASRTTFAGGIFDLYTEDGEINRDDLEAWLRNPDAVKDNASTDATPRGMPDLQLPERTIDDLVAYLSTLGSRPTDEQIAQTRVD